MDKKSFIKGILDRQKQTKEIVDKINYLKNADDKEYKQLKKEIAEQIILEETQINEDLEFLK